MFTSLLCHAFGIRGHRYTRTEFRDGCITFDITCVPAACRCSDCGSEDVVRRGQVERRFRSLPIGRRATFIVSSIPRLQCLCGAVRQVEIGFADPRRSYTRSFERYVLELGRRMTILDVARHLGVGWDMIKDIQKRDLSRRFARPKFKHLARIAIATRGRRVGPTGSARARGCTRRSWRLRHNG